MRQPLKKSMALGYNYPITKGELNLGWLENTVKAGSRA